MDRVDKTAKELSETEKKYGSQLMSGKSIIDSHQNGIGSYVENYIGKSQNPAIRPEGEMGYMPFNETLQQLLTFDPSPGKRTKFDAFVSAGLAIMACSPERYKKKKTKPKRPNVKVLFRKYENSGDISTLKK